jgi:hypothetical protein
MRHRGTAGLLVVALVLAPAAGCRRAGQGPGPDDDRELVYRSDAVLAVRIVNNSQLDATIYLAHDGARDRLGTVTAASTAAFTVRGRSLGSGDFALVADPVGATRTFTTERLHASQGTEFIWTIEPDPNKSSVLVRD